MRTSPPLPPYVLVSPIHNEAADIEKTLTSVAAQTVRPLRWVIVDDGSTDATAEIVQRFVDRHDWIEMVRLPRHDSRSFGSKVRSFNAGFERVKDLPYEVIGNVDGDISFDADHLQFLLQKFQADPTLGVAGTVFRERDGYRSDVNSFEGAKHVAGQCQLFRRECYEQIGGFLSTPHGGVDWIAVVTARMRGWKTRSFREKYFFHHRPLGTAQRSAVASAYSYGQKDYFVGGSPVWELMRVAFRATRKPYLVAGLALGCGFYGCYLRGARRTVSDEFMAFHRSEQMAKLKAVCASVFRLRTIDPFTVAGE
jgi:glycosyltransferase involved in cell wall biosynthesis